MLRLLIIYWYNLHSNMVLLKLTVKKSPLHVSKIYIPIWFYLNYDTKIKEKDVRHLHSNMVLLKHMWLYRKNSAHTIIYIPIWFYLNSPVSKTCNCITSIYIPIWFYLNTGSPSKHHSKDSYLHSNMVLLKQFLYSIQHIIYYIYIPIWFYLNGYRS